MMNFLKAIELLKINDNDSNSFRKLLKLRSDKFRQAMVVKVKSGDRLYL